MARRGVIPRGALARVSEHLGVAKGTVKNWMNGSWMPSEEMRNLIADMIEAKIDLSANYSRCGRPKGKAKNSALK